LETPRLETERLILRPITMEDRGFIYELFSSPETNRYSSHESLRNLEEAGEMYDGYLKPGFPSHFRVAVELKETGEPVGTLGLYSYSERDRRAELGYDLLEEHWGRGIMTEAVGAVLRYGFEVLGLNRVEATMDPLNTRSVRLVERLGFKSEGHMREKYLYKGRSRDELIYSLLRSEWVS
jgi:ribosomal-protein-alanine N-acetyltransferase